MLPGGCGRTGCATTGPASRCSDALTAWGQGTGRQRTRNSNCRSADYAARKLAPFRDFLAADLFDSLHVVQAPVLLGRGVRLWDGLEGIEERFDVEVVSSPSGVTHVTFTRR